MAQYRKRPIVIEAFQFGIDEAPTWFLDSDAVVILPSGDCTIQTLEGDHHAQRGRDWIVQGVQGEIYPVKRDIFVATYQPVV